MQRLIIIPRSDSKHGANTSKERGLGYYALIIDEATQEDKKKIGTKKGLLPPLWK
ncbi:MAG: hypothetical protein P4M11_01900 [Candidatus Pacebacteria bacterium]|nr:hypothetical protein [Candidatus Paceibacterota bacterium]